MRLSLVFVAAAFALPVSALAAPRPLNCRSKTARNFLKQALQGKAFSGLGSGTPKQGMVLNLARKADRRRGGKSLKQRRDGWNTLHMARKHSTYGLNVSLKFKSPVNTDTLVQMCTWDVKAGSAPKLVSAPSVTLKYKRHTFANLRAKATRKKPGTERVSLVWVSPASSAAWGQQYSMSVGPCRNCKAEAVVYR